MTFAVYRDAWGIPHLEADDANELAFAQGQNVAHDRAFQIEFERHRSEGTTASFMGPEALTWDRFARQARLDETARRCFANLEESTRAWLLAYVSGVNEGLRDAVTRSPEFATLGLSPGVFQPWTPLGIWLSTHILFAGFPSKLWREEVAQRLGVAALNSFATDGPHKAGSNGWLLSGSRTTSGSALLAGDPHRFLEDPGVYQQVHLRCPAFDVVGLAVPGVPGVAHFGHAGTVAWGITNAVADYQDLYFEQLQRAPEGVRVREHDGSRAARVQIETIAVRGAASVHLECIETERGPVIVGAPGEPLCISLRYGPYVDGQLGFDALPSLLHARSVEDVDRALALWVEPVNVVQAADTHGGLLHRVAGRVPRRALENRQRVVPGWDPKYAWQHGAEPLPRAHVDELSVMANERGLAATLGLEFAPDHRAHRIRALLDQHKTWSPADMPAIHMDTELGSANALLSCLAALADLSLDAAALRTRLLAWDRRMEADSQDAALYARVRGSVVGKFARHPALGPLAHLTAAPTPYPALFHPWLDLTARVAFALEFLLCSESFPTIDHAALVRAALEEVAREPRGERWGERHRIAPWQALPSGDVVWPGVSGDHDCVLSTSAVPGWTDQCARGPAARYVWDLGQPEQSAWVVPFGASGIAGDAHQRDQLPLWLRGELAPVLRDLSSLRLERRATRSASEAALAPLYEERSVELGLLQLARVEPARDAPVIYQWAQAERATFWGMREHSAELVREIYGYLASLPSHQAYLVWREQEPLALLQTYDPAAEAIGQCYPVQPGDLGVHLMLAPANGEQSAGLTGGLSAFMMRFVFREPTVERLVSDPDVQNRKAIARGQRCGFEYVDELDLPDKRAALGFLTRARYERMTPSR